MSGSSLVFEPLSFFLFSLDVLLFYLSLVKTFLRFLHAPLPCIYTSDFFLQCFSKSQSLYIHLLFLFFFISFHLASLHLNLFFVILINIFYSLFIILKLISYIHLIFVYPSHKDFLPNGKIFFIRGRGGGKVDPPPGFLDLVFLTS